MQCPAYVSSSEQGDWRVEEGEYELVKGIVFVVVVVVVVVFKINQLLI